jgi:hypothetical protein
LPKNNDIDISKQETYLEEILSLRNSLRKFEQQMWSSKSGQLDCSETLTVCSFSHGIDGVAKNVRIFVAFTLAQIEISSGRRIVHTTIAKLLVH